MECLNSRAKLTLFGARGAPNPRRVEIFLAEHGLLEGDGYAYVNVNMARGEHKRGGRYETPNQKLPMLKIGNHVSLVESLAICRYIEESGIGNASTSLFGTDALQRAQVEMWTRRVDLELLTIALLNKAWAHGSFLAPEREQRGIVTLDSELQGGMTLASTFLEEMDRELASREFVAGDSFSVADITLLCSIDFGAGPVQLPMCWGAWPHLEAWHRRVSARSSVRQHPNPYVKGEQRYTNTTQKPSML